MTPFDLFMTIGWGFTIVVSLIMCIGTFVSKSKRNFKTALFFLFVCLSPFGQGIFIILLAILVIGPIYWAGNKLFNYVTRNFKD